MSQPNGYVIADRLAKAPYAEAHSMAGYSPRENPLLRMYHALEAAGLVDDDVTADRDAGGRCRYCGEMRGRPHDEFCAVPRCIITGHQRLVCSKRGQDDHDCGVGLWAKEESDD